MKRTQVTGTDGFDGTGGRERCTNSMFLQKNCIGSISRRQMKSHPAQETVKHFTAGWSRSLLRCSLLYALGPLMNIKHSKQVISPFPPPLFLHICKNSLEWLGREGREVRKWLWGFHLPGVVGACFGSFSFEKEVTCALIQCLFS